MTAASERLRIVVLGYIVRGPLGGLTWHHLQYLLGLRDLGHDVAFVEVADDAWSCYDPTTNLIGDDPSYGLEYAARVFTRVGLGDSWAFYHDSTRAWHGPLRPDRVTWNRDVDVVINVSGVNDIPAALEEVPIRVYVDTDPLFTQVRHLTDPAARGLALRHNRWCTFGEAIPIGSSLVPDDGLAWIATRQPVVLEQWPHTDTPREGAFTTVMQWESYAPIVYDNRRFGMKSESFHAVISLPERTTVPLELAIGGNTTPRETLMEHGWHLVDAQEVSVDPYRYRDYIASSLGEFSVAKHGYVASRCGWFSERSTGYLASGRPVVTQDTGWTSALPHGEGLLAFTDVDSAGVALDAVCSNPRGHSRRAREIARECFDARSVLGSLLDRVAR